jgi:hypothetical protein
MKRQKRMYWRVSLFMKSITREDPMNRRKDAICALFLVISAVSHCLAADVGVQVGQVRDLRYSERTYSSLTVELRLTGDDLDNALLVRCKVLKAVDDIGKDLVKPDDKEEQFHRFPFGNWVTLKNPTRKATMLKELSGVVELIIPEHVSDAMITVKNFVNFPRIEVSHPALAACGAEITVLSRTEYEKEVAKSTEKRPAGKAHSETPGETPVQGHVPTFADTTQGDVNRVFLRIKDPNRKVALIEFRDDAGNELHSNMLSKSNNFQIFHFFFKSIPESAVLRVLMAMPKAQVTVPFTFEDIPLP